MGRDGFLVEFHEVCEACGGLRVVLFLYLYVLCESLNK